VAGRLPRRGGRSGPDALIANIFSHTPDAPGIADPAAVVARGMPRAAVRRPI